MSISSSARTSVPKHFSCIGSCGDDEITRLSKMHLLPTIMLIDVEFPLGVSSTRRDLKIVGEREGIIIFRTPLSSHSSNIKALKEYETRIFFSLVNLTP